MSSRRICVVTGSRAEFGLLKPLMDRLRTQSGFQLQVIATGMHLSPEFGHTYREIEREGFRINARVKMLSSSNTPAGVAQSMGSAQIGFVAAYHRLHPDIVVVLGDRFEIFSAVSVAYILGIPVAHIHGGEVTEGSFDEGLRHAITKMSALHFTSTEVYRKRVIQLGESPERVFNVGALGLDNIRQLRPLAKTVLERELGFRFGRRNLLVTYHPTTLAHGNDALHLSNLLTVLDNLKDVRMIFTKSNADPGGRYLNDLIDRYVRKHRERAVFFDSLGFLRYLSAMKYVDAVVGNSSSGIIEAPSFGIGTINVGERQRGRIKPASVIDCDGTVREFERAFRKLYSARFRRKLTVVRNPYGDGRAAGRIFSILKKNQAVTSRKSFYDLKAPS